MAQEQVELPLFTDLEGVTATDPHEHDTVTGHGPALSLADFVMYVVRGRIMGLIRFSGPQETIHKIREIATRRSELDPSEKEQAQELLEEELEYRSEHLQEALDSSAPNDQAVLQSMEGYVRGYKNRAVKMAVMHAKGQTEEGLQKDPYPPLLTDFVTYCIRTNEEPGEVSREIVRSGIRLYQEFMSRARAEEIVINPRYRLAMLESLGTHLYTLMEELGISNEVPSSTERPSTTYTLYQPDSWGINDTEITLLTPWNPPLDPHQQVELALYIAAIPQDKMHVVVYCMTDDDFNGWRARAPTDVWMQAYANREAELSATCQVACGAIRDGSMSTY